MGCDIHAVIEKYATHSMVYEDRPDAYRYWHNAGDPRLGRDYELFAVLAGVRNDRGIIPIAEPRGLPDDTDSMFAAYAEAYDVDGHSHSWLTLDEIRAFSPDQEIDDNHLVSKRDKDGTIIETVGWTNRSGLEPVGRRRVFGLWGTDHWDALRRQMERIANEFDGDGSRVRLVFFFDN